MNIAIGNDENNNICILTPAPGIALTDAANRYFGVNPFDEQDEAVLSSINQDYINSYSWDLINHVLIVDMVRARTCRMKNFKKLCKIKWKTMGVPKYPNTVLINLFSGTEKTDLESMKVMESVEQTILDTKDTIAELESYLPSYL